MEGRLQKGQSKDGEEKDADVTNDKQQSCLCLMCDTSLDALTPEARILHFQRCSGRPSSANRVTDPVFETTEGQIDTCPYCRSPCFSEQEFDMHLEYCGKDAKDRPSTSSNNSLAPSTSSSISSSSTSIPKRGVTHSTNSAEGSSGNSKPPPSKRPKKQTSLTLKAVSKMDESTQIALALSASLQPPSPLHSKSKKSSKLKFSRLAPSLIQRAPEDSQRIVADRVAVLLGRESQEAVSPSLPESGLSSRSTSGSRSGENNDKGGQKVEEMWSLSEKLKGKEFADFYVADLVGSLEPREKDVEDRMRNLSQVPGYKLDLNLDGKTSRGFSYTQGLFKKTGMDNEPVPSTSSGITDPGDGKPRKIRLVSSSSSDSEEDVLPNKSNDLPKSHVTEMPALNGDMHEFDDAENVSDKTMMMGGSDDEEQDGDLAKRKRKMKRKTPAVSESVLDGFDVAAYVQELMALSKTELDRQLAKIGVKPIYKLQAVALLTNAKLHSLQGKKTPKRKSRKEVHEESSQSEEKDGGKKKSKSKKKTAEERDVQKIRKLATAEEVHEFMCGYILKDVDLYTKLLQYDLIYIKPFLKKLKEEYHVLVKADLLMDFFDSQIIAFSQHDEKRPRQWGGKKKSPARKKSPVKKKT